MSDSKANWLITRIDERIATIALGPFFQYLGTVRDRSGLGWVHQLAHMSVGVIQALLLRAALYGRRGQPDDLVFWTCFLSHARAECMHPSELEAWAAFFELAGVPGQPDFCGVPRTPQTERLLDHLWLIAERGTAEEQVVVLNMVTEGLALAFYRATLTGVIRPLGMDVGRYWKVHEEADADHALLGVDLLEIGDERSDLSQKLVGLAFVTLDLFEAALTSWVPTSTSVSAPILDAGKSRPADATVAPVAFAAVAS